MPHAVQPACRRAVGQVLVPWSSLVPPVGERRAQQPLRIVADEVVTPDAEEVLNDDMWHERPEICYVW